MAEKPHLGRIEHWCFVKAHGGKYAVGMFVGHPVYNGRFAHTSMILSHDEKTGEIETLNSRYTLGEHINRK